MADKKTEVNDENLEKVSGGDFLPDGSYMPNFYGDDDKIAEQMESQYSNKENVESGVTSKGGNDSGGSGSGISNNNSSSTQKVGQQGNYNANSGSINM